MLKEGIDPSVGARRGRVNCAGTEIERAGQLA